MKIGKSIFSIYLLIIVIFGGVFHGSFMAYAGHIEGMKEGVNMDMISDMEDSFVKKIVNSQKNSNSIMACCIENNPYEKGQIIFKNDKNKVLNLEKSILEDYDDIIIKSTQTDLSYKYFSPPEKNILDSVIRIE